MLNDYIDELREVRVAIRTLTKSPYASASVSAGGGSKSYTFKDVAQLQARESVLISLIAQLYREQSLSLITPVYCF